MQSVEATAVLLASMTHVERRTQTDDVESLFRLVANEEGTHTRGFVASMERCFVVAALHESSQRIAHCRAARNTTNDFRRIVCCWYELSVAASRGPPKEVHNQNTAARTSLLGFGNYWYRVAVILAPLALSPRHIRASTGHRKMSQEQKIGEPAAVAAGCVRVAVARKVGPNGPRASALAVTR